jgi:hypothetical protein
MTIAELSLYTSCTRSSQEACSAGNCAEAAPTGLNVTHACPYAQSWGGESDDSGRFYAGGFRSKPAADAVRADEFDRLVQEARERQLAEAQVCHRLPGAHVLCPSIS